jgi:glycosyltransferase involved in cell wall biosynthesis
LNVHALKTVERKILVDVVVPSYRLNLGLLEKICSLHVPERWRTQFIIIVDNPGLLLQKVQEIAGEVCPEDVNQCLMLASSQLEKYLSEKSISSAYGGNNVRVRTNKTNSGASASRNRGLDESAAEYVLFLDDDVIPEVTLLDEYDKYLGSLEMPEDEKLLLGMVGLVKFPRHPNLQLMHAAVLMSYLTFMFEIASNPIYQHPAWGVTANLLVKRVPGLRFDTAYAKTGGGEDVDFCLRLLQGGYLKAAPNAVVHHPFWDGSTIQLFSHFFSLGCG